MGNLKKGRLVSNTGPIIALMLIGKLEILRELFDEVIVPEEVHREVLQGKSASFFNLMHVTLYERMDWIRIQTLSNPLEPSLKSLLDAGEASVVQTAREMGTDYVLIDERKARKIARSVYGLNVIGTARLLVEAKKNGLIDSVGDMIDKLRDGGYWIGDSIVQRMLKEAGET